MVSRLQITGTCSVTTAKATALPALGGAKRPRVRSRRLCAPHPRQPPVGVPGSRAEPGALLVHGVLRRTRLQVFAEGG